MAQHKGSEKIRKVLGEFKAGTLRSSSGQKVTSRRQAIAIALSEARRVEGRRQRRRISSRARRVLSGR